VSTERSKQEDQTTATDRREHPRHQRDLELQYLEIAGTGASRNAQLRDISQGGLCMLCEAGIPPGRLLVLGLELSGVDQPFVARGVVRHSTPDGDLYAVGIQFTWVGYEQRRALDILRRYLGE
jgi:c-di-GMP-binding flagellar brake protein YcgR